MQKDKQGIMARKINGKQEVRKSPSKKIKEELSLFDKINSFFDKRGKIFFWLSFFLMFVFSILLFDVKVSDGGDDSSYIVRAHNFIHHFEFPTWQGSLYPMVLSLLVGIFGIKLVVLKSFSLLCLLVFNYFFYKTFKNVIPPIVLYFSLFITSVNYFVLYFASQTYSEAFFMMIQGILFFFVFKYFISEEGIPAGFKKEYKKFILLGFWLLVVHLGKNIGLASAIAVLTYFILSKQWKSFLYTVISFGLFILIFEVIKRMVWGVDQIQIHGEGTGLLYKDFYNPSEGDEDFQGFLMRFVDNSNLYLSRHLYVFLGLKNNLDSDEWLTVLTYVLFFAAFFFTFRKNKYLLFTGIYVGVMCGISFLILQKMWDQWRLFIVYYPYILLFIGGGLYFVFEKRNLKWFQFVYVILLILVVFTTLKATFSAVKVTTEVLKKNIAGDVLYGMQPGWTNFIKMSQWASENVPVGKKIASRKHDMSFVYTGREFYPIYSVPKTPLDTFFKKVDLDTSSIAIAVFEKNIFRKKGVEHIYERFRVYIKAFVNGESGSNSKSQGYANCIIYSFPKQYYKQLCDTLSAYKVPYEKDVKSPIPEMKAKFDNVFIYNPDTLLKILKHNSVEYAIIINIKYTNSNGQVVPTMGTVSNFLHFIELKYPIISVVNRIGKKNEDAILLQIHYERLNAAVVKF